MHNWGVPYDHLRQELAHIGEGGSLLSRDVFTPSISSGANHFSLLRK